MDQRLLKKVLSFHLLLMLQDLDSVLIYTVHFVGNNLLPSTHFANVTLFNVPSSDRPEIPGFKVEILPLREFSITQGISAHFAESGLLKSLQIGGVTTSVNLEFVKYSTTKSGAYLFAPSKPNPDPLYTTDNHVIHLVTGPILSRVFVQLPEVNHTCTLFNSNGSDDLGLRIDNQVDVFDTYNFELVMRLKTNNFSRDEFFTDLNGLNIIKR
ncbi:GSCOCG00009297001-RA-CDS [Cotesia congregata]|nr:GSCOCG00009297001-RA-CDS [Cotesia congregata]